MHVQAATAVAMHVQLRAHNDCVNVHNERAIERSLIGMHAQFERA